MSLPILDYLGKTHASYVHGRGLISTYKLHNLLGAQQGEKILEIGFGTGATLVLMSSLSKADFYGFEISPVMWKKASQRIRFCGLSKKIQLTLLEEKNKFPALDNSFDRIYLESIIAIQEGDDFKNILLEIKRVLKPNGILIFNETIWLETTDLAKARHINERCKESFGIIQANHEFLHPSDWKKFLNEIGFQVELDLPVAEIENIRKKTSLSITLSNLYTFIGKLKATLSPTNRKQWMKYTMQMQEITKEAPRLMEGRIIKANNKP